MHTSHKLPRHARPLGTVAALCCLAAMLFSAAPALALKGYEPATPGSFGAPGSGADQLEGPEGVAVNDTTGDVYVADTGNDRIDEFEPDGTFVRAWGWGVATGGAKLETCTATCQKGISGSSPGEFVTPTFIAVDNSAGPSAGDVYVSDRGDNTVTKFTETGVLVESWGTKGQLKETTGGVLFKELTGIAVDFSGNLWVHDEENLDEFSDAGSFVVGNSFDSERGGGSFGSLAVDPEENIYLVDNGGEARRFQSGGEVADFNANATAVAINPSTDNVLVDTGNLIELYAPFPETSSHAEQTFSEHGLAESHGIAVSTTDLYASERGADDVKVFGFVPLRPVVGGESFSGVGSSGVTLHAGVDPEGESTSYFFEYGLTASYASVTPVESAGAGTGTVGVSATVEGLLPDTEYHFRVVASSAIGTVRGGDVVFSTFPVGVLGLPDGRGYELVSSLDNGDSEVAGGGRAAADGSAVAFTGQAPTEGGNGNSANPHPGGISIGSDNQYLAERSPDRGWSSSDVQPAGLDSVEYQAFSSDLSVGLLTSSEAVIAGAPSFSEGSGEHALYSREGTTGGYRLLGANARYAGSTPDGNRLLLSSGTGGLYETNGGEPDPVNVLPGGGSAASAVFGAPPRNRISGELSSLTGPDFGGVVSGDGSRVFWTETGLEGDPARLFVTESAGSSGERSVQLDASRVPGGTGGEGRFWTASSDGSRVFFTDCNRLTSDSTAVSTPGCEKEEERTGEPFRTLAGNDLYEWSASSEPGGAPTLRDLTPSTSVQSPGEDADVVGVLGASADGSYVYYAAAGALAPGAKPQGPQGCVQGSPKEFGEHLTTMCNVYVVHDGGAPQFVAAVTNKEWTDWASVVGDHSAYVASGGGQLVFESALDLTGFNSGGAEEIYIYEPGARLSCVSCNPSGAITKPIESSGSQRFGGPGIELPKSSNATYALRDITADGNRVFFDTSEGLVPQDTNGQADVYEWEAPGEGSCATGDSAYSSADNGCLYVLSGGLSTDKSVFVDASENGEDVFMISRADLVPQDHGESFQLFDARVGATPPPTETACTGAGCQGIPAAPPIFATPASASITGADDLEPAPASKVAVKKTVKKTAAQLKAEKLSKALKACHAKRGKNRSACEASARKKFGAVKKAKAKGKAKKAARR
jgi:hypothetical protein